MMLITGRIAAFGAVIGATAQPAKTHTPAYRRRVVL